MLRVSVIIPTYNRANYLPQALQSVFDQSYTPFEIIVVDDGSSDDTADVIQTIGPRIRYFRQDHTGVAAARNHGLEVAQGEIVAWLDADDLWEPNFLATVIPVLESNKELDAIYTGLNRIDTYGNILPQTTRMVVPSSELFSSLLEDCFIQTSTFVARKSCFEKVGNFDPRFNICEDYDMFLRLAKVCTIEGISLPLVRYRVHPHNTVGNMAAFCHFRLALTQKYFSEPVGDVRTWSDEKKRAHAFAFRAVALKYIQDGQYDQGWRYIKDAILIWPDLLDRLDTYFELTCSNQPTGYRGCVTSLDLERNGAAVLMWLAHLFADAEPPLKSMRSKAYGNAYLVLAMLSDQASQWMVARQYIVQALKANPRLLISCSVFRRLLKLYTGQKLIRIGRYLGQKVSDWFPVRQTSNYPPEKY